MKLRTFTADDMQIAMQMVRDAMGDDAIIIATKPSDKQGGVQIVAAHDEYEGLEESALLNTVTLSNNTQQTNQRHYNIPLKTANYLEKLLCFHGVNQSTLEYLLGKIETISGDDCSSFAHIENEMQRWFATLIAVSFTFKPIDMRKPSRYIMIGSSGAGKTLTTAKIAAYLVKENRAVHVVSCDNNKAGGIEQLAAITEILGVKLRVALNKSSLQAMLAGISSADTIVIDSAGANPYDFYALKELSEYVSLHDIEPILIYPAGSDPIESQEIAQAFSFMGAQRLIITRTDAARRLGSILNAAYGADLSFANITGTEKILGAFESCTPEIIAKLFFDFQPKDGL